MENIVTPTLFHVSSSLSKLLTVASDCLRLARMTLVAGALASIKVACGRSNTKYLVQSLFVVYNSHVVLIFQTQYVI